MSLELSSYPWDKWIVSVFRGGKGPQPLGTVVFEEIEELAKEKMKDNPGLSTFFTRSL